MNCFRIILLLFLLIACWNGELRQVVELTEGWQFTLSNSEADYSAPAPDVAAWRTLDLPHDWSIESDFSDFFPSTSGGGALPGGVGWYRKEFSIDKSVRDRRLFIAFDDVYRCSTVWGNDREVGFRPSGYASFRYDITPHVRPGARNIITVRVDNSLQPNSRWYSDSKKAETDCEILFVPNPRRWSPQSPNLYTLVSELQEKGRVVDRCEILFGIRTFCFKSGK